MFRKRTTILAEGVATGTANLRRKTTTIPKRKTSSISLDPSATQVAILRRQPTAPAKLETVSHPADKGDLFSEANGSPVSLPDDTDASSCRSPSPSPSPISPASSRVTFQFPREASLLAESSTDTAIAADAATSAASAAVSAAPAQAKTALDLEPPKSPNSPKAKEEKEEEKESPATNEVPKTAAKKALEDPEPSKGLGLATNETPTPRTAKEPQARQHSILSVTSTSTSTSKVTTSTMATTATTMTTMTAAAAGVSSAPPTSAALEAARRRLTEANANIAGEGVKAKKSSQSQAKEQLEGLTGKLAEAEKAQENDMGSGEMMKLLRHRVVAEMQAREELEKQLAEEAKRREEAQQKVLALEYELDARLSNLQVAEQTLLRRSADLKEALGVIRTLRASNAAKVNDSSASDAAKCEELTRKLKERDRQLELKDQHIRRLTQLLQQDTPEKN